MGKAYIVGCGPGSIDLLTVKAMKIIGSADVIIYDHLVNPEILDYARPECRKIYVGKKPYVKRISQEEINNKIVSEAKKFHIVVRLKGGDPFLFGRGGEEIEELIKNRIEYQIVPGVSSLISVPESAGIPLTHRDVNHGIIVTTGNNVENLNIPDCCTFKCKMYTMVIFMGAHNLRGIRLKLLSAGYDPSTPVAVIEDGTYNHQKTFTGTLERIDYSYGDSPSLIVIGDVVRYHETFCRSENKPYSGKIITVFYDLYAPDTDNLEKMGFTIFKIKSSEVFPGGISATSLYGKNIALEGRFVGILMDIFKTSGFDLRWIGRIATDYIGKRLLQTYGIFDIDDIANIDEGYIRLGMEKAGEISVANLKPVSMSGYVEDYVSRSDLVILAGESGDMPAGISFPDKTDKIRIKYPYYELGNAILSYFGEKHEAN
jgi:uroporphyrin-III C-methyltransferase